MNMTPIQLLRGLRAVALLTCAAAGASATSQPSVPWAPDPPALPARVRAAVLAGIGRRIFRDTRLSASGAMSCASCHDPANHFAPSNDLSVQFGGIRRDQPGTRAVPSLTYRASAPFFTEHYYESEQDGDESVDQGPTGGQTWDGRVNRQRDQAAIPLLAPNEMANESESALVARVAAAPYAPQMKRLYGERIFDDARRAFAAVGEALEAYQQTAAEFSPYSSKYDAVLRGRATLTAQETRGLTAFTDPAKGNCAHCHRAALSPAGNLPTFTDFGLIALGLPRNGEIAANEDPGYFDLGACGPQRKDLAGRDQYCGLFRAPSLRNVATRRAFYHNGVFHTLEDAVAFYATRDTNPERWYPVDPDGQVRKFDDLPVRYRRNVNTEPPFGGEPGDRPALSPQDIADIVAFLRTLTDGFSQPTAPVASATSADSGGQRGQALVPRGLHGTADQAQRLTRQ